MSHYLSRLLRQSLPAVTRASDTTRNYEWGTSTPPNSEMRTAGPGDEGWQDVERIDAEIVSGSPPNPTNVFRATTDSATHPSDNVESPAQPMPDTTLERGSARSATPDRLASSTVAPDFGATERRDDTTATSTNDSRQTTVGNATSQVTTHRAFADRESHRTEHHGDEDEHAARSRDEVQYPTLQDVRDWVAAALTDSGEAMLHREHDQGRPTVTRPAAPVIVEQTVQPVAAPVQRSRRDEPTTQDVHLSIGSIQVTIEDPGPPQKVIFPTSAPQRRESTSRVGRGADDARLNRHYVRTR